MNLYAESSAVLAWLLDEESAAEIRRLLGEAEWIVASDLTFIECDRVLLRAVTLGELTEAQAADRRAHLATAANHWQVLRIAPEIVDRAAVAGLRLLSLNDRVRKAGKQLGLDLLPA